MAQTPFPIIPELMAITIAYRNQRLIADDVLPRVPVGLKQFLYLKHRLAEGYTVPDTKVGRKSVPNLVEFNADSVPGSAFDYGLDDIVPNDDINNAPKNYNPLGHAVESITRLIFLDREVRVANTVFNAANYSTSNKQTLSGTSQFSDYTNSDPISVISSAMDAMVIRPNVMVIGRPAFSVLSKHPKILKAVYRNLGDSGIARKQDIADLFELEQVLVGESQLNTAKKGETANIQRVWGKHISLIYQEKAPSVDCLTYGVTAQYQDRIAGSLPEPKNGLRGSVRVRVGESVSELIMAPDAGYFLQNVAA